MDIHLPATLTSQLTCPTDPRPPPSRHNPRLRRRLQRLETRHPRPRRQPPLPRPDLPPPLPLLFQLPHRYPLLPHATQPPSHAQSTFPPNTKHPNLPPSLPPPLTKPPHRSPRSNLPTHPRPADTHPPARLLERHHLPRPAGQPGLESGAERRERVHEHPEHVDGQHQGRATAGRRGVCEEEYAKAEGY